MGELRGVTWWTCLLMAAGLCVACGSDSTEAPVDGQNGANNGAGGPAADPQSNAGDGDGAGPTSSGPNNNSGPDNSGPSNNSGPVMDDPPTPAEADPDVDWEALDIVYSPMYSAYDGGAHVFSLPAYVNGLATEPEAWEAFPADAVSFAPWQSDDGSQVGVLITIERAEPEVIITASEAGVGGKATLYITDATPEQWEVGQERYINGETFDTDFMNDPEFLARFPDIISMLEFDADGNPMFTGTAADLGLSTDMRCDTCHTSGAENFQVQHTPTQAARFSDQDLINIFTMGKKPPGIGFRALPEMYQNFYEIMHLWDTSDEEVEGLVVYLRSLAPEGQGDILLPTGFFVTEDIDWSKLPASCNPDGGMLDVALCLLELPPICNPINFMYDMEACGDMLGIDLGSSSGS